MGSCGSKMVPTDEHAKQCVEMLTRRPQTKNYKKDVDMLKAIDSCYNSNVYGGSIFQPIGSADRRGPLRHKANNLEAEIKNLPINYLYGGGFYTLKHVQHSAADDVNSEAGAMFSDIFILVESIENLDKMQQIKVISDMSPSDRRNQKPILMEDLADAMTGYGRVIEYRAYSSDFAPDSCKIERVKEGKFKNGKMEGYARKFTGLKGGNCFVGFFKEGKPDGKLEVLDHDGYVVKQGIYNDSECIKEIEINNYTTRLIKTGKEVDFKGMGGDVLGKAKDATKGMTDFQKAKNATKQPLIGAGDLAFTKNF